MANYRSVYCEFWNDAKVSEEMTPEDRLFMLYLLTNPYTSQIGVYEISKKRISFELGYTQEVVNALMDRFINYHKLVKYNVETREIAVKNWGRYNFVRGGKPVLDLMNSELKKVKDKSLMQWVYESYVDSANSKGELNIPICELFENFLYDPNEEDPFECADDANFNEPSHDTSDESYNETGAKRKIKEKEKIKELKPIVHADDQKIISKTEQAENLFNELWALYPQKRGKGQVKQRQKLLLLEKGREELVRAINRYLAYVTAQRKGGFNLQYQNGSTFFHSGFQDFLGDDYVEPVVNVFDGKSAGAGISNSSKKNGFHNFEQSNQSYSNQELEAKLRGKAGGGVGSSGSVNGRASGQ